MNILVIGGSGFIGTRLIDELLVNGHQISIFDINKSAKYPDLTTQGDIRSLEEVTAAARGIDVIYNLAAEHRDDVTPLSLYHDVNITGAKNVIHAAVTNNVQHIVFTSTVAIYGLDKNCPDETSPAEPFNEYGRTKWEAEKLFQEWARQDHTRTLGIIRPAVVFGEGNRGNVYNLIAQISSGRFILIGSGKNRKSMAYVGNVAQFLAELLKAEGIQVFNFCDKPDLCSLEIANVIADALGIRIPRIRLPLWIGLFVGGMLDLLSAATNKKFPISAIRVRKFAAETTIDTSKLEATGFKPRYYLSAGIRNMVESDFETASTKDKFL